MIPKWRIVMSPALVLVILITISLVLSAGCSFESKIPDNLRAMPSISHGMLLRGIIS